MSTTTKERMGMVVQTKWGKGPGAQRAGAVAGGSVWGCGVVCVVVVWEGATAGGEGMEVVSTRKPQKPVVEGGAAVIGSRRRHAAGAVHCRSSSHLFLLKINKCNKIP